MTNTKMQLNIKKICSSIVGNDKIVEEYEQKQKMEKERIRFMELEENYFKFSNVPLRFFKESLETYNPTPENMKTFKWILGFTEAVNNKSNKKNIIYLSGKFGTGKTHLGCGMIRKLGGMIITSLELCITYDSCKDFKADKTRIQFLKWICSKNVLVIDEIGKGISSIESEIVPYIINDFYGSGKILIFLGNKSRDEFEKIIGSAGKDRMEEVGCYLSLIGESNRSKKA